MMNDGKLSNATAAALGVWLTPGYGIAYPELKKSILDLHVQRASMLNFVPSGWADAVKKLQENNPDDLVRFSPGLMQNGTVVQSNPEWIKQTAETASAWHKIFEAENAAISAYARKQQQEGKAELDRLYREASFWNTAYAVGKATGVVQAQAAVFGTADWFKTFMEENQNTIKLVGTVVGVLGALWILSPYFRK